MLPNDMLTIILSYSKANTFINLCNTCQSFQWFKNHTIFNLDSLLDYKDTIPNFYNIKGTLSYFSNMSKLKLSCGITSYDLLKLPPNVTSLKIHLDDTKDQYIGIPPSVNTLSLDLGHHYQKHRGYISIGVDTDETFTIIYGEGIKNLKIYENAIHHVLYNIPFNLDSIKYKPFADIAKTINPPIVYGYYEEESDDSFIEKLITHLFEEGNTPNYEDRTIVTDNLWYH